MDGRFLEDPEVVKAFLDLRNLVLGNARMLYGSEAGKFYDIVVSENRETGKVPSVVLTVAMGGSIKILREEVARTVLSATRKLVSGLIKDTAMMVGPGGKYALGDQISGQQGESDPYNHTFALNDRKKPIRSFGAPDDTKSLPNNPNNRPMRPPNVVVQMPAPQQYPPPYPPQFRPQFRPQPSPQQLQQMQQQQQQSRKRAREDSDGDDDDEEEEEDKDDKDDKEDQENENGQEDKEDKEEKMSDE